jgi:hypothetical protein
MKFNHYYVQAPPLRVFKSLDLKALYKEPGTLKPKSVNRTVNSCSSGIMNRSVLNYPQCHFGLPLREIPRMSPGNG